MKALAIVRDLLSSALGLLFLFVAATAGGIRCCLHRALVCGLFVVQLLREVLYLTLQLLDELGLRFGVLFEQVHGFIA